MKFIANNKGITSVEENKKKNRETHPKSCLPP